MKKYDWRHKKRKSWDGTKKPFKQTSDKRGGLHRRGCPSECGWCISNRLSSSLRQLERAEDLLKEDRLP